MLGSLYVCLEYVGRKIANHSKDGGHGERSVEDGRRWLRPADGFALQEPDVTDDAVGCGEG